MKRSIVVLLACLMLNAAVAVRAQVVHSASGRKLKVYAGGEVSMFQPDFAGGTSAGTSPNRLYGVGAFVDADLTRWVGIEAEGRWLKFNQYEGIDENTYLIGPRVPIITYKGFTPYGKFLFGMGSGSFLDGRTTALAYGGGVDYRLSKKFSARFDYEYQNWRVTPNLYPYGGSVGIKYRIF